TSAVSVTLEGVPLGTATTDDEGGFTAGFTVSDCDLTGGTLTASVGDISASTEVTLEPCPSPTTSTPDASTTTAPAPPSATPSTAPSGGTPGGQLPATGASVAPLVAAGVLLLASGAGTTALAARRRRWRR
ncbi:hypothetical protein MT358_27945, partial [Klebsiella pneumoniae]|nr:hypothetical protein [Klebsiella pneumoniae]